MKRDANSTITVKCPTCQKSVEWSDKSPFRPFCSKRCQLIDLGEWAAESHRIPADEISNEEYWSENAQPINQQSTDEDK